MLAILFSARLFSNSEIDRVAQLVAKFAHTLGTASTMFNELLKLEFERSAISKSTVILRANSLATKGIDQFISLSTSDFISQTLHNPVKQILNNQELDLEIDPSYVVPTPFARLLNNC